MRDFHAIVGYDQIVHHNTYSISYVIYIDETDIILIVTTILYMNIMYNKQNILNKLYDLKVSYIYVYSYSNTQFLF